MTSLNLDYLQYDSTHFTSGLSLEGTGEVALKTSEQLTEGIKVKDGEDETMAATITVLSCPKVF